MNEHTNRNLNVTLIMFGCRNPKSVECTSPSANATFAVPLIDQDLCKQIMGTNFRKKNIEIVEQIEKFHYKWIYENDLNALIEANYLIDYYCTYVSNACDKNAIFEHEHNPLNIQYNPQNPLENTPILKNRKFKWATEQTYEVLIKRIDYNDGLKQANEVLTDITNKVKKQINNRLMTAHELTLGSKGYSKYIFKEKNKDGMFDEPDKTQDWQSILTLIDLSDIVVMITQEINRDTLYYASAHGMYRLVNQRRIGKLSPRRPCNCICRSFTFLCILHMLDYPREFLFGEYQSADPEVRHTHWGAACLPVKDHVKEPINSHVKEPFNLSPHMHSVGQHPFGSSEAFKTYTIDMINYMLEGAQKKNFVYENERTRDLIITVLQDLEERFELLLWDPDAGTKNAKGGYSRKNQYIKMTHKHIGKDKISRVVYQKDSKLYVKRKCDDGTFKYVAIRSAIGLRETVSKPP